MTTYPNEDVREIRYEFALDRMSKFERRSGRVAAFRQMLEFMIEYLSLMAASLPPHAGEIFEVAKQFRTVLVDNPEIERARESSWHYLLSRESRYDFDDRENCAIRAAFALLQRDPPTVDLTDILYWFLAFANKVEDHSDQIDGLVRKYLFDERP